MGEANHKVLQPVSITVNPDRVTHTMAAGAGASWHAIGPTVFSYKDLVNRANRNARGSGYGGNPPLEFRDAWDDLLRHARWLGLNFIRVEIDMRMYEPERGRFDWENEEMRTLYRILDYCQENGVDVFFTQMFADVEWNAFPGISRLQSAPRSVPDFATGLATLMEHLIKSRGYSCIRWLCITNEPGFPACWWIGHDGKPANAMPTMQAVRDELDRRGTDVMLSGPDWCDLSQNSSDYDLDSPLLGALDAHHYRETASVDLIRMWVDRAHARGLPFFQSEFGSWCGDNPFENPTSDAPASYSNQLLNAEKFIGGLNAGVDGFNRWSFVNRGDLDGKWQLVRTWDPRKWDYYERVTPEPVPYIAYGILTRFMAKYSDILQTVAGDDSVAASAIRSPRGNLTVYVLNKSDAGRRISLSICGPAREIFKYQVSRAFVESPGHHLEPEPVKHLVNSNGSISDATPAGSVVVYSTYHLPHSADGVISD